eukprot:3035-Heterococcus_DN1.PRE.2
MRRTKHKTCRYKVLLLATWQVAGATRYGSTHQQAWLTCCKVRGGSDPFDAAAAAALTLEEKRNGTSTLQTEEPAEVAIVVEEAAEAGAVAAADAFIEIEVFEHEKWGVGRTWMYRNGSPAQSLGDIKPSDSCEFTSEWSVDCTLEGNDADSDGWQYPTSDGGWSSKPDTKKHSEQSGLVRRRRWVRSMHQKEQQQQQQQQQQQTDETVQVSAELNFQSNSTASAANATASDTAADDSASAKDVIAGMCNKAITAATSAGDASTDDNSTVIDSTTDLDVDSGSSESFNAASEQDDWLFDSESAASESAEHSMSDNDSVITEATDTDASHDDEQQSTEVAVETLLEPEPMPPVIDTAAPNIAAVPVAVLGDTLQLTQAVAASAGNGIDSCSSSSSSGSALDSAAAVSATLQTSNTTAGAIAAHPVQALQQWWDREFNFRGFGIGVVKPVFAGSLFRRQDFGVGVRLPLTSHFHSWEAHGSLPLISTSLFMFWPLKVQTSIAFSFPAGQVKGWAVTGSTKTTDLLRAVTIGSSSKRDRAIKPKKRK